MQYTVTLQHKFKQRRSVRHWQTAVCGGVLLGMSNGEIWFHPYNNLPPQREPGDAREVSVKPNEAIT